MAQRGVDADAAEHRAGEGGGEGEVAHPAGLTGLARRRDPVSAVLVDTSILRDRHLWIL